MDYEQIKQLMKEMENSKLESINIELADGTKISMKKENELAANVVATPIKMVPQEINGNVLQENLVRTQEELEKKEENLKTITSPMVGTFYAKASPSSNPFVKVGDRVKKGDVLCIIEAMKLMNEIESDIDGEIVEVCCKEEELVEYGTVLFKIKCNYSGGI